MLFRYVQPRLHILQNVLQKLFRLTGHYLFSGKNTK